MINYLVGGVSPYPSEKYDFVSWDDDIPNMWKQNHQPAYILYFLMT